MVRSPVSAKPKTTPERPDSTGTSAAMAITCCSRRRSRSTVPARLSGVVAEGSPAAELAPPSSVLPSESAMPARYTLHGIFASGPTYKVGLMLSLAGEPFDYVHVNLREGEHKRPEYLAKQRFGQVPLLVDNSNGRHLGQSAAILEYLADKTGKFGGATLQERMDAREWVFWEFDRLSKGIYRPRAAKLGFAQFPAEVVAHYEADGQAGLKTLESHLGGRSWIVGDAPSFADIDVYGVVAYAPQAGVDLSAFPNVSAWMKRVEALPGFRSNEDLLPKETKAAG